MTGHLTDELTGIGPLYQGYTEYADFIPQINEFSFTDFAIAIN